MEVFDEDITSSEFVAYTSVPVRCLAPGVRNCKLFDERGRAGGDFTFASLAVRVAIE